MASASLLGKGSPDAVLSPGDVRDIVRGAVARLSLRGKRVLTIVPDGTRTMPMPLMFSLLQEAFALQSAASDYLVALGTHRPMDDEQLSRHIGHPVTGGLAGNTRILNHRWDLPETFLQIGVIPQDEVAHLSQGLLRDQVPVRINRLIFDYDHVLICGPVFPHEVVGFSGGNKYLFPGIGGREMIDFTHWLGALLGSYQIIGSASTPVRAMIDRAAAMVRVPVSCLALVLSHQAIAGLYFGAPQPAWQAAAELSSQRHIVWLDQPFRRVLAVMPTMYDDMWTAAKGMYKVEPAIEDGGEVIIYAPHIVEFSYVHGDWIESIGYHCRDYFLAQWEQFAHVPKGILAHSTHLKGKGEYDSATGFETPRLQVTLATGISQERCRRAGLGYLDPRAINLDDWRAREAEGMKLIPRAGETLYKLRP